jgi:copper chaperone
MATTESYSVTGMTCDHCATSVAKEIGALTGVTDVQVDLGSGRVAVHSEAPLDVTSVRGAVEEASS